MKQVWILNHYAQEPGGAGGTRHYSLARHLRSHDWQASLVVASVDMNTGRQRLAENERTRVTRFGDIPFLWIRTPEYQGNGGGRMLNMLTYAARVLFPSTTRALPKPDVIVGSSVHPFAAWSGAILAKRHRVPFVFEVRDLWPQTLIDMGRLRPGSLMARALRRLEIWLYERADRIVVLLPSAADYIVPLGIPAEKIVWIPNGVELDDYPVLPGAIEKDKFTLMYFGAHGQANGLDCLLRAMAELKKLPDMGHIRLCMIGDGPQKSMLMDLAHELDLDNVEFSDPVPKRNIPGVAAQADAFAICVRNLPNLYRFGISMNKLFDYLAAGRPIVMASNASNDPIQEAGAGLTVEPENPEALARAIATIAAMPASERAAMGSAGREYVEKNHSFEHLAAKFGGLLNDLVAKHR